VEGKIGMAARRQVTKRLRWAYASASKAGKGGILDELLSTDQDNPTTGLLLCRTKNALVAECSPRDIKATMASVASARETPQPQQFCTVPHPSHLNHFKNGELTPPNTSVTHQKQSGSFPPNPASLEGRTCSSRDRRSQVRASSAPGGSLDAGGVRGVEALKMRTVPLGGL
jgi:hypothetical protein